MRTTPMVARVTVYFAAAAALLLGTLGFLVYSLFQRSVSDSVDDFLRSKADDVVESITVFRSTIEVESRPLSRLHGAGIGDAAFFADMARLWTKDRASDPLLFNAAVEILDNRGETIAASHTIDARLSLPRDLALRVLKTGPLTREVRLDSGPPDQSSFRSLSVPVPFGGDNVYVVQVIVGLSRAELYLARLKTILLLFIPVGFFASTLAGWMAASSSVRPLRRMVAQLRVPGSGPPPLLPEPPITELAELARAFNGLLAQVTRQVEERSDFFNDVSHQLKTPLAIMRGEIEVALRQDRDREEYRRVLLSSLQEVQRMSLLVSNILTIARRDARELRLATEETDLAELAAKAVASMRPLAEAAQVLITLEAPSRLRCMVDAFRVTQALMNLLDNAIRYAPGGSEIGISLRPEGETVLVSVADRGPGVPAEERSRLFTRYHRGNGSHSGGDGIGLAVVKSVADLHGGGVGYEAGPGGSVFSLRLPLIGNI